jgi:hypothetical protein
LDDKCMFTLCLSHVIVAESRAINFIVVPIVHVRGKPG